MKRDTTHNRDGQMPISRGGPNHIPEEVGRITLDPKNLDPETLVKAVQMVSEQVYGALQVIDQLRRHQAQIGVRQAGMERALSLDKVLDPQLFFDSMMAIGLFEREAKGILAIQDPKLRFARVMIWNNWVAEDPRKRMPCKPADFGLTEWLLDPRSPMDPAEKIRLFENLNYVDDRESFREVLEDQGAKVGTDVDEDHGDS